MVVTSVYCKSPWRAIFLEWKAQNSATSFYSYFLFALCISWFPVESYDFKGPTGRRRWVQKVIVPIGCSRHEITSIWYFNPSPTSLQKSNHILRICASTIIIIMNHTIKQNRTESSRIAPDWFPLSFFHHGPRQPQCAHLPHQWSPRYFGPPAQHHEALYKSNSEKRTSEVEIPSKRLQSDEFQRKVGNYQHREGYKAPCFSSSQIRCSSREKLKV